MADISALNPNISQIFTTNSKTQAGHFRWNGNKKSDILSYLSPKLGVTILAEEVLNRLLYVLLSRWYTRLHNPYGERNVRSTRSQAYRRIETCLGIKEQQASMVVDEINQIHLLEGFIKFVAFILPSRAPGIDLLIPVV